MDRRDREHVPERSIWLAGSVVDHHDLHAWSLEHLVSEHVASVRIPDDASHAHGVGRAKGRWRIWRKPVYLARSLLPQSTRHSSDYVRVGIGALCKARIAPDCLHMGKSAHGLRGQDQREGGGRGESRSGGEEGGMGRIRGTKRGSYSAWMSPQHDIPPQGDREGTGATRRVDQLNRLLPPFPTCGNHAGRAAQSGKLRGVPPTTWSQTRWGCLPQQLGEGRGWAGGGGSRCLNCRPPRLIMWLRPEMCCSIAAHADRHS